MKLLRILAFLCGTLSLARGQTAPTDWTSVKVDSVGSAAATNTYNFWPDPETGAPRVMATSDEGTWLLDKDGPLSWTSGGINPDLTFRSGQLFPNTLAGTFLLQNNNGSFQVVNIANGVTTNTTVASNVSSLVATDLAVTVSGANVTTHIAFAWLSGGAYYVSYASRTNGGVFVVKTFTTGGTSPGGIGLYAASATDVKVYFTFGTSTAQSVLKMWNGTLPASVASLTSIPVGGSAYGAISNCAGSLYFSSLLGSTTSILAINPTNQAVTAYGAIGPVGNNSAVINSLKVATAPDGQPRMVAYDSSTGSLYYIKTDNSIGKVLSLTGTAFVSSTTVQGVMFDPNGVPLVLYRKTKNTGYVAYPIEAVDADDNGRLDLADIAFGDPNAGPSVPDIVAPVANVTNSDNRFKIQFPVLTGAAAGTGTDAGTVKHVAKNIIYRIQTSTDLVNWVPAPTVATQFKITLTTVNGDRIATGVFTDVLPSATLPKKFARVLVSRITPEL